MPLLDYINDLNTWGNTCRLSIVNLEDELDWRELSQYNMGQHGGIGWVAYANRQVIADLIEAMQYFVYGGSDSFRYDTWFKVHWGLFYQESEVTWQAICEAWVKDDFEGRGWTIAVIDKMRQIVWDEPFDIQWAAMPDAEET